MKIRERRRKRGLGKELRMGIISPDSQKCAHSAEIEMAMIERLNSKSFDLNSKDLNRK